MTASAHGPGGPAPGRPTAVASTWPILTRLIQPVTVAMNLRLFPRRSLHAIEQDLAVSDPSLTHLFSHFTLVTQCEERGPAEETKTRPLRALAHRLATALEFDPADPYRRSPTARRVD
jgi:hypothetical protein